MNPFHTMLKAEEKIVEWRTTVNLCIRYGSTEQSNRRILAFCDITVCLFLLNETLFMCIQFTIPSCMERFSWKLVQPKATAIKTLKINVSFH